MFIKVFIFRHFPNYIVIQPVHGNDVGRRQAVVALAARAARLVAELHDKAPAFAPIDPALVPDSSLLREEFIK